MCKEHDKHDNISLMVAMIAVTLAGNTRHQQLMPWLLELERYT